MTGGPVADTDQLLLRHACDRCHTQKLRCPRSVDLGKTDGNPNGPCSRCRKAGMPCTVSLRGKAGRPSKVAKKKANRPLNSPSRARALSTPENGMMELDLRPSWEARNHEVEDQLAHGAKAMHPARGDADLSATSAPKSPTGLLYDDAAVSGNANPCPLLGSKGRHGEGNRPSGGVAHVDVCLFLSCVRDLAC